MRDTEIRDRRGRRTAARHVTLGDGTISPPTACSSAPGRVGNTADSASRRRRDAPTRAASFRSTRTIARPCRTSTRRATSSAFPRSRRRHGAGARRRLSRVRSAVQARRRRACCRTACGRSPRSRPSARARSSCIARGADFEVGRASFRDNPRGQIIGDVDGFVKLALRSRTTSACSASRSSARAPCELIHVGMTVIALRGHARLLHPERVQLSRRSPTRTSTPRTTACRRSRAATRACRAPQVQRAAVTTESSRPSLRSDVA